MCSDINRLYPGTNHVLLGPADPDHYRIKVGRFGDRFYCDPLPADAMWGTTDASWPSVSTVKLAADKNYSRVTIKRAARRLTDNPRVFEHCRGYDEYHALLVSIDESGLKRDGGRGNDVHRVAEGMLRNPGAAPSVLPNMLGAAWVPALVQWFRDYTPELVAAEVVVINRSLHEWGYGGTFDAFVLIDGRLILIDFKTRGADVAHRCDPLEAAQLGGYQGAEYAIIADPTTGHAIRVPVWEADEGWIVSLKPDGYKVYPVDLGVAYERNWAPLHAWWCARRDDTKAIKRPLAPLPVSASYTIAPQRLRERVTAIINAGHGATLQLLWPEVPWGQPVEMYDPEQLDAIVEAVRQTEDAMSAPFHPDDAPGLHLVPPPANEPGPEGDDEGGYADPSAVAIIEQRARALPEAALAWLATITEGARYAGTVLSLRLQPTVRRFEIARALVFLAEADDVPDDALLRYLIALVTSDPDTESAPTTTGALVAALTLAQARQLATLTQAIGTDALVITVLPGGGYSLAGAP